MRQTDTATMADSDALTHISLPDLIRLQADARALKLPSARPVKTRQAGLQQSPQRGRGMAFAEVRQYQPGDDIRSIDWRVTARRQAPHTKLYEEERERPVLLLCDLGPTLFFASIGAYKQVRSAQVAGLLAWLALWAGDQVGGIVFNEHSLSVLRPARRKIGAAPAGYTGGPPATAGSQSQHARRRRQHQWSRSSAGRSPPGSPHRQPHFCDQRLPWHYGRHSTLLGALARHNSVSAIRIVDPLERELPSSGRFAVAGPGGPVWFDAANTRFQQAWRRKVDSHEARLEHCFRTSGVASAMVSTGDDPAVALKALLGPGGRIG